MTITWTHPLLVGDAVALPTHGLTLIELGTQEQYGHWPTAVESLVDTSVAAGRPVAYVQAGGDASGFADAKAMSRRLASPLLVAHHDDDEVVYGPPVLSAFDGVFERDGRVDVAGRPYYFCNSPTLPAAKRVAAAHESGQGPTLLIIDAVDFARPYCNAAGGQYSDDALPWGYRPTRSYISRWRAADLQALAESRAAPTVAVWVDPEDEREDLEELARIALLRLVTRTCSDGQVLTDIATRSATHHVWRQLPAARRPVWLPS